MGDTVVFYGIMILPSPVNVCMDSGMCNTLFQLGLRVPPVEMFLNRKLQVTVTKKFVLNF